MSCAGRLGKFIGAGSVQGEHTFIVIASDDRLMDALREPGKAAGDLLNPMDWQRASELCCGLRVAAESHCNCKACRDKREIAADVAAMQLPENQPE